MSQEIKKEVQPNGETVFTLCGTNQCCPTVTVSNNGERILKDDYGGEVRLTAEQFRLLQQI